MLKFIIILEEEMTNEGFLIEYLQNEGYEYVDYRVEAKKYELSIIAKIISKHIPQVGEKIMVNKNNYEVLSVEYIINYSNETQKGNQIGEKFAVMVKGTE